MAEIELVIKIPEEIEIAIKRMGLLRIPDEMQKKVDTAIQQGRPLPKEYGRLIDADVLEKKMCDREEELGDDKALYESSAVTVALDMFAPTIVEANNVYKEN